MEPRSGFRSFIAILVTALAYYLLGRLALPLAIEPGIATAVWPPSGIALAAILLVGYRVWPGIWLGSCLVNIGPLWENPKASAAVAILLTANIATGSTLQAVLGGYLVKRLTGSRIPFDRVRDVFLFVGIEVVSCILAPCFGVMGMYLGALIPWDIFGTSWWTWWTGDLIGVLVVCPFLLSWSEQRPISWKPWVVGEFVLLLFSLMALSELVFSVPFGWSRNQVGVAFMLTPPVMWAALRFGHRGATITTLLVSAAVIWGTITGHGPFLRDSVHESLLLVQAFMGVVALMGLTLAAALSERTRAEYALRQSSEKLEHRIEERTADLTSANATLQEEVAERRQAEQALRQSEEKFRFLIEGVKDYAMYMLDPTGHILSWNAGAERIKGYRADEVLGRHFSCFYPEEAVRESWPDEELKRASAHGRFEDEGWRIRKDGSRFWANVVITALRDEQGSLKAFTKITRDLTERLHAQEKLRQVERLAAIGEMISGLAHESRNALQRSQSCLEMLAREVEKSPKSLDLVARIQSAQDHLHYLYEGVRKYASPIVLNLSKCHLGVVLQETWDQLTQVRRDQKTSLRSQVTDVDLHCWADPHALRQVLGNIIENSWHAGGECATIDVYWSNAQIRDRAAVRIVLRDNGPGLSPEQKAKIFDPFYTTKTHGTGLGMAIAKRIVEAHGGEIAVGDTPGPGTEIQITLPREQV